MAPVGRHGCRQGPHGRPETCLGRRTAVLGDQRKVSAAVDDGTERVNPFKVQLISIGGCQQAQVTGS